MGYGEIYYNLRDLLDEVDATGRYIRDIRRQYAVRDYYLRGGWNREPRHMDQGGDCCGEDRE
ncbi:MAG: hypothetical protein K2I40_07825 [Bifidobacterium castoris]|nr:hypothetical protein [Bifidobacterium castoris]